MYLLENGMKWPLKEVAILHIITMQNHLTTLNRTSKIKPINQT